MNYFRNSRFSVLVKTIQSNLYAGRLNSRLKGINCHFIWIPKTAGTSVFKSLEHSIGMQKRKDPKLFLSFPNRGSVTFGHVSYTSLLALGVVSRQYDLNSYKFCFVRNPYARAVSLFNYLKQIKKIEYETEFERFLDNVHLHRPPIGLYNSGGLSITNPQSDWVMGTDGKLFVNDYFKVENINDFILKFEIKFKVKLDLKTKLNVSSKQISLESIWENSAALEKITLIYKRDFDLFDYDQKSIPID